MDFDYIFAIIVMIVLLIVIIGILSLLLAFPVMWCWNYVMPYLFGLPILNWGRAWCLTFLCGILLKSSYSSDSKQS